MKAISVYFRSGRVFVAPMDGMVVIAPVFEPAPDAVELATALKNAIAAIPAQPSKWTTLRDYESPVRIAANVKTERQFERGLRWCTVYLIDDAYQIRRWIPYPGAKSGFAPDDAWQSNLSRDTSMESVAKVLLDRHPDPDWPSR